MKPRSKSEWMTPAAPGALVPRLMVQARTSWTPRGEVGDEAEEAVGGVDEAVEAGFGEAGGFEELGALGGV